MPFHPGRPGAPESPQYVALSLAAALTLGLEQGWAGPGLPVPCINLLQSYADGCRAGCRYCGLARDRRVGRGSRSFIRVDWPVYPTEQVIAHMVARGELIERVCLSMVVHARAYADALTLIRQVRARVNAPFALLCAPPLMNARRLHEVRDAGVDMLGIGLDAATPAVFQRQRRGRLAGPLSWDQYWSLIAEARAIFGPWHVNCHIVVGLGETDADILRLVERLHAMEVHAFLFSFYPEQGSALERRRPPPLVRWRRLQLATYLLECHALQLDQIALHPVTGRIVGLKGVPPDLVCRAVASGEPFLTDGCRGARGQLACTRPYGSYRASQPFRDYPFRPGPEEIARIRAQLRLHELLDGPTALPLMPIAATGMMGAAISAPSGGW